MRLARSACLLADAGHLLYNAVMKRRKRVRVYVDTSVFGGVFDAEFSRASKQFFDSVGRGVFDLVISVVVADEIVDAPARVQSLYHRVAQTAEVWQVDEASLDLRDAYIK